MVNFAGIPLVALSKEATFKLSTLLNPPKVLQTCDKRFRDWRGLAAHFGLAGEVMPSITSSTSPTERIFELLRNKKHKIGIDDLVRALQKIDRWDILDDLDDVLSRDALDYSDRLLKGNAQLIDREQEEEILTVDDLYRRDVGLPTQNYDGFLLYAEEDRDFADQVIENLEEENELRLCIKDRDLIANVTFEHDVLMQLIDERCNRLIVILSPDFIKSSMNTFLLSYAQARGIAKRERKIVPILYEQCEIPRQLHATFLLDYKRVGSFFWRQLEASVRSVREPGAPWDPRRGKTNHKSKTKTKTKTPDEKRREIVDLQRHVVASEDIVSISGICYDVPSVPDLGKLKKEGKKRGFSKFFSSKEANRTEDIVVDLPSVPLDEPGEGEEEEVEKKKEKKKGVKDYVAKRVRELVRA